MNLIHILKKRDNVLLHHPELEQGARKVNGAVWSMLRLPNSTEAQLVVQGFSRFYPFRTRPDTIGWMALAPKGDGTLRVSISAQGSVISETSVKLSDTPILVPIPWPISATPVPNDAQLELHFHGKKSSCELLVHRRLDREAMLALARGKGIEIGPGPKPQIFSGRGIEVEYVEEMPQEEWDNLYNKKGAVDVGRANWSKYHLGKASNLPAEDSSLDFIFSSHVFEHLANPLGHLQHWSKKLRPGGLVLAIVPDIACGNKDYQRYPARLSDLITELHSETWEPTLSHYRAAYATSANIDETAQRLMAERFSIHVHVYNREAISDVLDYAQNAGWFSGFNLLHTPNHKDFHFICRK